MDTNTSAKVINLAHDGYRRAGVAFTKGENLLSKLDKAQLAQIEADPRLKLLSKGGLSTVTDDSQTPSGAVDDLASAAALVPDNAADNTPSAPVKSSNEQDMEQVFEAIASLELANKDHFTVSGKPQAAELEKRLNRSVSASERDGMWQAYQDNQIQDHQDEDA